MGNQQIAGIHFKFKSDLYAPVLTAHEVRLLVAIASQRGAKMCTYDTSQAFLYGATVMLTRTYMRGPRIGDSSWCQRDTACSL
jgi:hypothetical protein